MFKCWPVEGYNKITQLFNENKEYYKRFGLPGHEGIDFRAPEGTKIVSVMDGTVKYVYNKGNYGINVRITSGDFEVIYAHLSLALVKVGQELKAGEVIGLAGSTGNSSAAHLHITVKEKNVNQGLGYPNNIIDPYPLLKHLLEEPLT